MKSLVTYISEKLVINRNTKVDDDAVDLGLSVKWCKHNVGAEKETDRGLYFSWANTDGHYDDGYKFDKENYKKTKGSELKSLFTSGDKEYDAATANMGSEWRMPTKKEFEELYDNTTNEWTTINGQNGRKFISKADTSKYVFFPAVGYYSGTTLYNDTSYGYCWSSSINPSNTSYAYYMLFYSSYVNHSNSSYRYIGLSVRAVQD